MDNPQIIPWPEGLPPAYNGSTEPCDMLVGPCSCGAWHDAPYSSMKIKQLTWFDVDNTITTARHLTNDMGNQTMYIVRTDWDNDLWCRVFTLDYYFGYIPNGPSVVGKFFTADDAKMVAQKHFEQQIKQMFLI
jgi:hypothetical protein